MRILISIILAVLTFQGFAQPSASEQIFSNAHGLYQRSKLYFEVEGYSGFAEKHDNLSYDERGIKKARRKYKIPKGVEGDVDSLLKTRHRFFVIDYSIKDGLVQKSIFYFVPIADNKLKVIAFSRAPDRDLEIERLFVESIVENKLAGKIVTSPGIDWIDFAGRRIYLGNVCRWMSPHNVQCPDYGQISWSTFRSYENAKNSVLAHFEITAHRKMGKVLEKDSVNVLFEGVETMALKIKYKIRIPRLIMGGSNILIIYYVAEEIRGKNIACVMSQFTDDVNARELAPLLHEVMKLRE